MQKIEVDYNKRKKEVEFYTDDELLEINYDFVNGKDVHLWFEEAGSERNRWKGLLEEICEQLDCNKDELEFCCDSKEFEDIFNKTLIANGGCVFGKSNKQDIAKLIADWKAQAEIKIRQNSFDEAKHLYNLAIQKGDNESKSLLAEMLDFGEQDDILIEVAEDGNQQAIEKLYKGYKDIAPEKAKYWLEKLMKITSNPEYQIDYAESISDGDQKFKSYLAAAQLGDAKAQYEVGMMYYLGEDEVVEEDKKQAFYWFEKSAEQGNAEAQYQIGLICFLGESSYANEYDDLDQNSYDNRQAHYWFEKSAKQNNVDAQYALGLYFCDKKSYKNAMKWFKKAARQGNVDAKYEIGELYYYGRGVDEDEEAAFALFDDAAEQGSINAKYKVGLMTYLGQGTKQNCDYAVKVLEEVLNSNKDFQDKATVLAICINYIWKYKKNINFIQIHLASLAGQDTTYAAESYFNSFLFEVATGIAVSKELIDRKVAENLLAAGGLFAVAAVIPVANIVALPVAGVLAGGKIIGDWLFAPTDLYKNDNEANIMYKCLDITRKNGHKESIELYDKVKKYR